MNTRSASPNRPAPGADVEARRASVQRSAQRAQRAVMMILMLAFALGVAMVLASYRAFESQRRAEKAEAEARERSWRADLAQARAERLGIQAGHRANALAAISNAAAIRPSIELRDEAIASFALRDLEKEVSWQLERGAFGFYFDPKLEHYIVRYALNENSMFRLSDNVLVRKFRSQDAGLPTNAVSNGAIFSLTGKYVAVTYVSGEIVLHDRDTAEARHVFGLGDEKLAWRPTFTEDDEMMCARSTSRTGIVVFVNLRTGHRREIEVPGVNDTMRMNHQGETLAWNFRTNLFLNETREGALLKTISWPANVFSFRWNAQGNTIAVWCGDGTLNLLDVGSGRIRQLGGKLVGPWVQYFSPDGSMLASSGNDGTTRLWDVNDARLIVQTTEARSALWSEDNSRLALAIPGQKVGVWRITQPRGYRVIQATTDRRSTVWRQDLSPNGHWAVVTPPPNTNGSAIELFHLPSGGEPLVVPVKGRLDAGFHPTEPRLFVANQSVLNAYRLEEPANGGNISLREPEKIPLPGDLRPCAFTFSADGKHAVVLDARGRLAAFAIAEPERVTFLEGGLRVNSAYGPASVTGSGSFAMSRDGKWVVAGRDTADNRPTIWNAATGKVARRLPAETSHVAFSPDGRWLVTIGSLNCILWETESWKQIWSRQRGPFMASVGSAAFTADGSMFAFAQSVDAIEILEPATGAHIANMSSPTTVALAGLRFSADGELLAAPSTDGRMHLWNLRELRSELSRFNLDWPIAAPPDASRPGRKITPMFAGGIGLGAVSLAGLLGLVALRRHGRLTREFVDTTERAIRLQESERAAQRALEQEKELSRLKSQFVNTVSHEFRNPLGVIMSSAENLRDYHERFTPEQRAEHLRDIFEASLTMSGLMEEVLLLGRVDAGKVKFQAAAINLRALCERLIDEVRSATDNHCPIQFHFIPGEHPVRGDEGLLRHIIVNLLTNAVKYSPGGRPVELRIEPSGIVASIKIRDHGIGIPAEDQPHLFEAFHRGRNVGEVTGTGLGMVIVKRCIELHGGTIHCDSRTGEGTTFTVQLPLYDQGRIPERPPS